MADQPWLDVARRQELVERVHAALVADDRVESAELFGSIANGGADEFSDIDIFANLRDDVLDRDFFYDLPAVVAPVGTAVHGWSFAALTNGQYGGSFLFDEYPLLWGVDIGCRSVLHVDATALLDTYRWEQIYKVWIVALKSAARAEAKMRVLTSLVERYYPVAMQQQPPQWIGHLAAVLEAIERRKVERGDPYEHLHRRCLETLDAVGRPHHV